MHGLTVEDVKGPGDLSFPAHESFRDGAELTGPIDLTLGVWVNETTVYIGKPEACQDLQQRIDDARTARCMALYGRLLPYQPQNIQGDSDFSASGDSDPFNPP